MSQPRLLDEIAPAGPKHLDPAYVAGYDRKGAPADFVYSRNALHHLPE